MNVCLYQGKIWIPEFSKVGEAKANPDFNSKSSLGERQNSSGSTHFSFMEGAHSIKQAVYEISCDSQTEKLCSDWQRSSKKLMSLLLKISAKEQEKAGKN